jgi:hypothetical protein
VSRARSSDELTRLAGLRSEPFELIVERGKVREFALATKASHPAYLDDPEPVVPPTFLACAAQWAPYEAELLERTGWDRKRMLHASQEYVFPGKPPRAGMRLRGAARIESAYERQGRRGGLLRFVVIVTEFADEMGTVVAEARTTVVETSMPPGEAS